MNIQLDLHIKKDKVDCALLGPILAPYGIDINKVVKEINTLLEQKIISNNSKVPIDIDLKDRSWKLILTQKKVSEQLKELSKNNKIKEKDLENFVIQTYKTINQNEIDKKINELKGTIKSMHIEIIN